MIEIAWNIQQIEEQRNKSQLNSNRSIFSENFYPFDHRNSNITVQIEKSINKCIWQTDRYATVVLLNWYNKGKRTKLMKSKFKNGV